MNYEFLMLNVRGFVKNCSVIFFVMIFIFLTNCKVNVTDNSIPLLKLFIDLVGNKTVAMPTFTPPAGNYTDTQNVKISTTTLDAIIRYTTDGTEPKCSSGTIYDIVLPVIYTTTLKAIACKTGWESSGANAVYTLPTVYAGGNTINRSGFNVGGYWKNGTWVALSIPNATKDIYFHSFTLSDNDIYAVGSYNSSTDSSVSSVYGYWKNGNWTTLNRLDTTKSYLPSTIALSGADVYIGGVSLNSSGISGAGYWKNEQWIALPSIDNTKNSTANQLTVFEKNVYISGYSENSLGKRIPVYWKNGSLVVLTSNDNSDNLVNYVFVSGNDVYASGGNMQNTNTSPGYWKNGTWIILTSPDNSRISLTGFITVIGTDVYANGYSPTINGAINLIPGYWKNGVWIGLSQLDATKSSQAGKLVISGTDVYLAGYSTNSSGARIAGFWRNGNWIPLFDGINDSSAFYIVVVP